MISCFPPKTIRQHVYKPHGSRAVDGLSSVNVDRLQSVYNPHGSRRVDMLTLYFQETMKKYFFHALEASTEAS
jgi:hypothetical protein